MRTNPDLNDSAGLCHECVCVCVCVCVSVCVCYIVSHVSSDDVQQNWDLTKCNIVVLMRVFLRS